MKLYCSKGLVVVLTAGQLVSSTNGWGLHPNKTPTTSLANNEAAKAAESSTTTPISQDPPSSNTSRRYLFEQVASIVVTSSLLGGSRMSHADDNVNTPTGVLGCTTPQGQCAASEENEFIRRLQAQSQAKRAEYEQQSLDMEKLSYQQFQSQYQRPKYIGIRRLDGSFQMATPAELEEFIKEGSAEVQYGTKILKKTGEEAVDYSKRVYIFTK